jgi:IS4 transposase
MKDVVQRLLAIVRRRDVKVKYLLLDKGFFNVAVLSYLNRAGYGYIVPAVPRGRKPKKQRPAKGLRALLKKRQGHYKHTLTSQVGGRHRSTSTTICVASRSYTHEKTGKRRQKKLLYAVRGIRLTPRHIWETYRKRFGIETTYRQMNEARIKTCTTDPRQRLLFVGVALVLRNVWVWLHFQLARGKWNEEPEVFLQLLRFSEFLLWITQIVQRLLRADQIQGIDYETYERVTAQI